MTRVRIMFLLATLVVVFGLGTLAMYYARGYRFSSKNLSFGPNGLLVANSDPEGAQVIVDGELESATDATIPLPPGTYWVEVKKEGFLPWGKTLRVEKEVVTQIDVVLFSTAPSLSAVTFSGAFNPLATADFSKFAYGVPVSLDEVIVVLGEEQSRHGLWVSEVSSLPIGFGREPRRITDLDVTEANWEWSPDGRQILLTAGEEIYLLDIGEFMPENELVDVSTNVDVIKENWEVEAQKRLETRLSRLPEELQKIFMDDATDISISAESDRILYTALSAATLPQGLIKALPGSSTQEQTRDIEPGKKYVFYVKEDRNFEVASGEQTVLWFPTGRHLILPKENEIVIMDDDGTNSQTVFSGSYSAVLPYAGTKELLLLTNLGANGSPSNLYSLKLQ